MLQFESLGVERELKLFEVALGLWEVPLEQCRLNGFKVDSNGKA